MANLNKVFLIGNLTRDPELRYTPSGAAVVTFGFATNRNYTTQTGERKQEVCFLRITVWGKQGENCSKYLTKGSQVFIEGRLQYRAWESNGQKRSAVDVRADRVQFLGRPKSAAAPEEPAEPQSADSDSVGESVELPPDFLAQE